jgi:hypothetical protein
VIAEWPQISSGGRVVIDLDLDRIATSKSSRIVELVRRLGDGSERIPRAFLNMDLEKAPVPRRRRGEAGGE